MRDPARGFFAALIGDGRPLLAFTGLALIMSGGFALLQSASGHFLPHDVEFKKDWYATLAMPRRVFDEVGGWPGEFRFVHEGVDLAWRVLDAGYRVLYQNQNWRVYAAAGC